MQFTFHYVNIDYIFNLEQDTSDYIPLGAIGEWFDGLFWNIYLVGRTKLVRPEWIKLDSESRKLLLNPYIFLEDGIKDYLAQKPKFQKFHILQNLAITTFPNDTVIQAPSLYQYKLEESDTFEKLIAELKDGVEEPYKIHHWYRDGECYPEKTVR